MKKKPKKRKPPNKLKEGIVNQQNIQNSQVSSGVGNKNSITYVQSQKKETAAKDERKPFYQQWWFGRILGAIIAGGIVAYFANKYGGFHFGDTWLGVSALISTFLLMRNPKRAYLRWAGFCVMAIASINILSQIDVAFKITDTTAETRPWDFFFKLGVGEEPIISMILGVLAGILFVLDYRVRKENL